MNSSHGVRGGFSVRRNLKSVLAVTLCFVMILGSVAFGNVFGIRVSSAYSVGDFIEYGNYPQSKLDETEDAEIIAELSELVPADTAKWRSYGYYSGTDKEDGGDMEPSDFMRYMDVVYNGKKYRAVVFDTYRPYYTGYPSLKDNTRDSVQDNNGYIPGIVYWFRFEPLRWRVLDPAAGLVMCATAIDSQPYNNYYVQISGEEEDIGFGDPEKKYYASNYERSSIRSWLNEDFLKTAFTPGQRDKIVFTDLDNSSSFIEEYDAPLTTDRIFLLSYNDVTNSDYGFNPDSEYNDSARQLNSTDYAKCQGCEFMSDGTDGDCWWELRTPYNSSGGNIVFDMGIYREAVNYTSFGIVPAFRLSELASDTEISLVKTGDIVEYGNYPQSKLDETEDAALIKELEKLISMDTNTWYSYGYYIGEEDWGTMKASDFMRYRDVYYDGAKYRAVIFDSYRPAFTLMDSTSSRQEYNGYSTGNVYWFKYEPLRWRVLDPSTGYVMCDITIDAQAYNNACYWLDYDVDDNYDIDEFFGDAEYTYFASNYARSSIRAWLNDDFYNTAFTSEQKSNIVITELDNSSVGYPVCNAPSTEDNVFLISYEDSINEIYGFSTSYSEYDPARQIKMTDYAKCQGCSMGAVRGYEEYSHWLLRNPTDSFSARRVDCLGESDDAEGTYVLDGIVPAITLDNIVSDSGIDICIHSNTEKLKTNIVAATCTNAGENDELSVCKDCGQYVSAPVHRIVPATGHNWSTTYDWTPDYSSCTASFVCGNDSSHTASEICTVSSVTTPATCETAGETVYTAKVNFDGKNYMDVKTEPISATEHDWNNPVFIWADNFITCTASFICDNDSSHTASESCTVTSATTPATCKDKGKTVYTAKVTFNGAEYTDSKEKELTVSTTHTPGEWFYNNDATYTSDGTESRYCTTCRTLIETRTAAGTKKSYELPELPDREVLFRTDAIITYIIKDVPEGSDVYIDGHKAYRDGEKYTANIGKLENDKDIKVDVRQGSTVIDDAIGKVTVRKDWLELIMYLLAEFFSKIIEKLFSIC